MLRPRDFIETVDGLFFAVVSYCHPAERYVSFLSYYRSREKAASTKVSFRYLRDNFPEYVFKFGNAAMQGVPKEKVLKIYRPVKRLEGIYKTGGSTAEKKVLKVSEAFSEIPGCEKGVTGSILVRLDKRDSDIDFVFYGLKTHEKARGLLDELLGSKGIRTLDRSEWTRVYRKRFPAHKTLSFEDFLWHEKRKHNRAVVSDTIFDMLLVRKFEEIEKKPPVEQFKRVGRVKIRCTVSDSALAFDSPAVYRVECADRRVDEVVSFTHTYAGQAFDGEEIEVSGVLERHGDKHRVIVGTTREAEGEYIKVLP